MSKDNVSKKGVPHYKPGDKIYKLFDHEKVIIEGNQDTFVINIDKNKR
ncbi:MAG: hypothetical protein ACQESS_06975 [Bacillota bacterium]